jgi:hypothetical protein
MYQKYFILFLLLLLTHILFGQTNKFKIITQDVRNFWEAVDSLRTSKDTTKVFQTLVIDRASDEFKVFIRKWNIKASHYTHQIKRYPTFYATLRKHSFDLINSEDSIRKMVRRFENFYPNTNPADICIGLGNFATGGNIAIDKDKSLVYIGLEYHGVDATTDIKELNTATQDYVSRSNFFRTIIHELVHVQQRTHGQKVARTFEGTLLANRILSEGIADLIARLIVPQGNNGNYYSYGIKNETELKAKLKTELFIRANGNWFGGDDSLFIDKPRDLGYFMGARIGESYYTGHKLAGRDLTSLIEIKNLKSFIKKSKYFEQP